VSNRILILDYSVDRSETALVQKYLRASDDITALFIEIDDSFPADLPAEGYTHVIHTGSSLSITVPAPFSGAALSLCKAFAEHGTAQMGICYGHQLICLAFCGYGAIRRCPAGLEAGWENVRFTGEGPSIPGTGESEKIWQSHFDEVVVLPPGSVVMAENGHSGIQAFFNRELRLFGTQFHPEFDRDDGNRQFLHDRDLLEASGLDADRIISGGPTVDCGSVFIGFFLDWFSTEEERGNN
jgi:GMP synthase (glutamine-hydrolysing)